VTEWEFVGEVKEWIALALDRNTDLPFSSAKLEQRGRGSNKRRDLTLLDKHGAPVITGEVKLPFAIDGTSPFRSDVVIDARKKAELAGVDFFFTWNVNQCVLWRTATAGAGVQDREYEQWAVTHVTNAEQLKGSSAESEIRDWLIKFLRELARALRGDQQFGVRSPDSKFVDALEAALAFPIDATFRALQDRYKTPAVKRDLDRWIISLGWQIVDDAEGKRTLLRNAAKFACYLLVNKLVFHEALLKKYKGRFDPLKAPPEVTTGDDLQQRLQHSFEEAKRVTGDYETVFGDDPIAIANAIPFYANEAVPGWRALLQQIHDFDFSKLDYEVVGGIFERLISPEERHKYGQFYTRVEVVDLINSFCIRDAEAKVMDPACGGGTFLVRAYARKRALGGRAHKDLLTDIYGVDISKFAAHLTTMNLATRDLVEDENYPRIGRDDFFNVMPQQTFVQLPQKLVSKGLGKNTLQPVAIPFLDAVIGNPPYVRQEDIPKAKNGKKTPEAGTKEFYQGLVKKLSGAELSGRSDLHCYFWPHASSFLQDGGMLGLITSSQWLDVEYGFRLQRWLLQNFEILAVLESPVEPWFVGARVATTVTIARKCADEATRNNNTIRFVQLRAPLGDLLQHDGTTTGAIRSADFLRDEILGLTANCADHRFRARLLAQGELWKSGVDLGRLMRSIGEDDEDETQVSSSKDIDYFGGKWGVFLRAPDLWFELLDKYGERFVPLGQLAEIRRGITSGKDSFFFPKDISDECLAKLTDPTAFEHEYGVPRKDVESGRVKLMLAGEKRGELHAIESEFLEPEVHSLMGIESPIVTAMDCESLIFLCPTSKRLPKYASKYVKWGESLGIHQTATCSARVTEERDWYDLTGRRRAPVLWPKEKQYRHIAPANPDRLIANCRLYEIYPSVLEDRTGVWGGLLNSSIALLSSFQYGRPMGNEGNWSTMVVDVNVMLTPDLREVSERVLSKIETAFKKLSSRKQLAFVSERRLREMKLTKEGRVNDLKKLATESELDMPDRRALDDAVLELLGVKTQRERDEWLNRLYEYLRAFFEATRQKEEKAIVNKNTMQRKGAVSPQDVATEIIQDLADNAPRFLRNYNDYVAEWMAGDDDWIALEIVPQTEASVSEDMLQVGVDFKRGKKIVKFVAAPTRTHAEVLALAGATGVMSFVKLPKTETKAALFLKAAAAYFEERTQHVIKQIAERTADQDAQEKVLALVRDRLRAQLIRSGNQIKDSFIKAPT
jgi:hypothetical protein